MASLKWTKDYGKFKFLPFNRPTDDKKRILRIAKSIEEFGFIAPVIVSLDNFIIDGQNKFLAAKFLKTEFCYVALPFILKELPILVSTLNSVQKSWTIIEYIRMWAMINDKDHLACDTCRWIMRVIQREGIPFRNFYQIMSKGGGTTVTRLKNGSLTFSEEEKARSRQNSCY